MLSFASRLVVANGVVRLSNLCAHLELNLNALVQGDEDQMHSLADFGGVDARLLMDRAFRSASDGLVWFGKERVAASAIHRRRMRACPQCLALDRDADAGPAALPLWSLVHARRCFRHGSYLADSPSAVPNDFSASQNGHDVSVPGNLPTPERKLEDMKRGELRWSSRDHGWEILIPSVAFKNANSSFFGSKPFRLILPDLGRLYELLEAWIDRHRSRLIGVAADPDTLFVKTAKMTSTNAAYCQNTFYEAWRTAIQRYGIYNPWTERGAIKGLLPHGPHNVRDVLATHILKQTGSYEQASYAIQDTAEMVAQHYGRFLPQDKAEIAARILNQVWEAA